jgi:Holliday junction resolvase RusA-like endonuclease
MNITLPIPPSANNLFINVPGRGRVMSTEYRQWRKCALSEIAIYGIGSMAKPYGVHIRANVNHRRDIDNLAKPILDALVEAGVIIGDQWVDTVRIDRDGAVSACSVEVWSI